MNKCNLLVINLFICNIVQIVGVFVTPDVGLWVVMPCMVVPFVGVLVVIPCSVGGGSSILDDNPEELILDTYCPGNLKLLSCM
jgi:hypothetical protein